MIGQEEGVQNIKEGSSKRFYQYQIKTGSIGLPDEVTVIYPDNKKNSIGFTSQQTALKASGEMLDLEKWTAKLETVRKAIEEGRQDIAVRGRKRAGKTEILKALAKDSNLIVRRLDWQALNYALNDTEWPEGRYVMVASEMLGGREDDLNRAIETVADWEDLTKVFDQVSADAQKEGKRLVVGFDEAQQYELSGQEKNSQYHRDVFNYLKSEGACCVDCLVDVDGRERAYQDLHQNGVLVDMNDNIVSRTEPGLAF